MNRLMAAFGLLLLSSNVAHAQSTWHPTPFPSGASKLPPGYQGDNASSFYHTLAAIAERFKKDEFETTGDYEARTRDVTARLAPIDPSALYAFKLNTTAKYDADRQIFVVQSTGVSSCARLTPGDGITSVALCEVATEFTPSNNYVGVNPFGATTHVDTVRGLIFSLGISSTRIEQSGVFGPVSSIGTYSLNHEIQLPLSEARMLRGKSIGVLMVGRVTGPKLLEGSGLYSRPTLSDPVDMAMSNWGIPFELSSVVFYVVETGQILEGRAVSVSPDQTASDLIFDPVPGDIAAPADQREILFEALKKYLGAYYHIAPDYVHLGQTTVWNKAHHDGIIMCTEYGADLIAFSLPSTQGKTFTMKVVDRSGRDRYLCNTPNGTSISP